MWASNLEHRPLPFRCVFWDVCKETTRSQPKQPDAALPASAFLQFPSTCSVLNSVAGQLKKAQAFIACTLLHLPNAQPAHFSASLSSPQPRSTIFTASQELCQSPMCLHSISSNYHLMTVSHDYFCKSSVSSVARVICSQSILASLLH